MKNIKNFEDLNEEVLKNQFRPFGEVQTLQKFKMLSKALGVRSDWHEPDEQGVSAEITGDHLDNAGAGPEFTVVLKKNGKEMGKINLATLLAMAAGTWAD